ncbi:uncharacterized protein LTHEOB_3511 [Lasiodiplodia theobromae]|uniref:uncharacterized protein n=1 Tax=Lasiodiplodia theobromae TaxID=45133 RepID=UPI0015C3B6E8|nr:uncharacterized protein LTHEOB_3511 [Lasiodiplodia theobromae]KAF4533898.1 hypothetical protein LTHEOB_3511 [Lasiodiplodia theobromae]
MDKNTGAAEGSGTSHRPGVTRNAILDSNHSQSVKGYSGVRVRPTLSVPGEIKKHRTMKEIGQALKKKVSGLNINQRKGNQATPTTESPTQAPVPSLSIEQPVGDAHYPPQLPQFHVQHTSDDQPVEEDKTDQEDHHSQEGLAEESDSGEEDEPEGQDRPQLSNLARYFWSRLDVAYQYYVDDRDDDCQMNILAPYSERVLELRTKGYNIRGALREYHELANESRSTSDDEEMDDLAE